MVTIRGALSSPPRPDLPSPSRATLAGEVFRIIRDAIVEGLYTPGAQLSESLVAKQLGTSRTPVREALRQLEREGVLNYAPHRGYSIPKLGLEDVQELFHLRSALEGLAVSLVVDRADVIDFRELEETVSEMEANDASTRDLVHASDLDTRFHEQLCRMSGNKRLVRIWENMRAQIHLAVLAANSSFPLYEGFSSTHRSLLETIESGDKAMARKAIAQHLEIGLANLTNDLLGAPTV